MKAAPVLQTILIVEKPANLKEHIANEWTGFGSTVAGILKGAAGVSMPHEGIFLIDLRTASRTLGDLLHTAAAFQLPYRMLNLEDPQWIEWKYEDA